MPGTLGTATAVAGFYNGDLVSPTDEIEVEETVFLELYMCNLVNGTFTT